MSVLLMKEFHDAFTLAVDHQQNGRGPAAAAIYHQILAAQPECAAALNNLGLLVSPGEAVVFFRRAVAAEPKYIDALVNLSGALRTLGEVSAATQVYERAVALIPSHADDLFRLAYAMQVQGRFQEAATLYDRVISLKPDHTDALCNLGVISDEAGRPGAALDYFRQAWRIAPETDVIGENLVIALENAGRLSEAKAVRSRLPRPRPLIVSEANPSCRTVLLAKSGALNVPLRLLLPTQTNTLITWLVEYATDAQMALLPPHDIAFNTIGNADVLDEAYDRLEHFARSHTLLNPPHAVAQTRRDRLPKLLEGIPGVMVPQVVRIEREAMAGMDVPAQLAEAGLEFPMLVRSIVGHGGEGVQLVQSAEDLRALVLDEADAYYFLQFYNYRSQDGCWRKYRVIFVDRVPFAYHLAISDNWLVHYFSADMLAAPWKRQEEQRFVESAGAVLPPATMVAIAEIGRRLDLDYGGMDFAILDDGQVLVFEANASMLVHLNESIDDFPYKHASVPAIIEAFGAMLDRHVARPSQRPPGKMVVQPS